MTPVQLSPVAQLSGYVLLFGLSALACFASVPRASRVTDPDTRRGLVGLLVTSGAWAAFHAGYLLAPGEVLQVAFYEAGLVVGLAAVGPWLYFCSAYTGRSLHRNATIRRALVALFLVAVAVKLTNPLHHLYFTTPGARSAFGVVLIQHEPAHWVAMGLAYALSAVGFFMLFELFVRVSHEVGRLTVLVAVAGLPTGLDLLSTQVSWILPITYEPIGVAVFAVGVAFVYLEEFEAIRLAGDRDEPVVFVDADDRIREYNAGAAALFPALEDRAVVGRDVTAVLPEAVSVLNSEAAVLERQRNDFTRYYRVSSSAFASGRGETGRMLVFDDVTDIEQYRAKLERKNDRLEAFASTVSHDLRNPLNVASLRIDQARRDGDEEALAEAAAALDRIEEIIEDILTLAREGQSVDETEQLTLRRVVEQSWEVVETADATLEVAGDVDLEADPNRLQQLFENLVRNAVEHGSPSVTVTVGPLEDGAGFYVADDGPGIPESERDDVLESGYTTADDGTGFGLAIVREIAEGHGWSVRVTESATGGARFEFHTGAG